MGGESGRGSRKRRGGETGGDKKGRKKRVLLVFVFGLICFFEERFSISQKEFRWFTLIN